MKYLFKILLVLYLIVEFSVKGRMGYEDILILLLIVAVNIFKERFFDSLVTVIISSTLILAGVLINKDFSVLLCTPVYDFINKRFYVGLIPVLIFTGGFVPIKNLPVTYLLMSITAILSYQMSKSDDKELTMKTKIDDERRLRYEMEETKAKLLNSAKEIANIAEIRERNRIAREIHDSVGHSIAGILIQLQAAYKVYDLDREKSLEIVKKSIDSLSDALTLLRDTVHNIKPREKLGIEYMKKVIENFAFCPVDLKYSGDFNQMPPNHFEILASNIKEALTNASKHSKATRVEIIIDMNERYTRLYIKDNGVGCEKIKEGMGLSGMKERIQNIGGSISISSDNGFLIVCFIPRGEGDVLENTAG